MSVLAPSPSGHDGKRDGLIPCSSSGLYSDSKLCTGIGNCAARGLCTDLDGDDDDIRISYTKEEPISWKEMLSQPFINCGVCQEDEERAKGPPPIDLGTMIWYLSGMEFIRLSCVEPEVTESFVEDAIFTGIT